MASVVSELAFSIPCPQLPTRLPPPPRDAKLRKYPPIDSFLCYS
jgi:hypothetical protein